MSLPSPDLLCALARWLTLPIARAAAASTSAPTLRFMSVLFPKDAILIVSSQVLKSPPTLGTGESAEVEETRPWTAHESQPNCV